MGTREKTRYLYALLTTLPFGILAFYYGIEGLATKTNVNNLHKTFGIIVFSGEKEIPSKAAKGMNDALVLSIKKGFDTIECHTFVTVNKEKLQSIVGQVGKNVTVWFDSELENQIEQVEFENRIILQRILLALSEVLR